MRSISGSKPPNSREAKIETLELTDMPARPDRTTRVRITATPLSDEKNCNRYKKTLVLEIYSEVLTKHGIMK